MDFLKQLAMQAFLYCAAACAFATLRFCPSGDIA
jgi:hypothetical protein